MANEEKNESNQEAPKKGEEGKAQTDAPKLEREIIIRTDGNSIKIIKSEVAGMLELKAILRELLESFNVTKN